MQLYIIRHAQSENNAMWARTGSGDGRLPDPPLTAVGQKQARLLAQFLAQMDEGGEEDGRNSHNQRGFFLTHLYTSLMERAVQTGTCIAQALGLPLVAWEEIHEWGGIYRKDEITGERIGLPGPERAYFADHYPGLVLPDSLGEAGWWNRPFEPRELGPVRARRFLHDLLARHGGTEDRVAIVTHGGFTQALANVLLGFVTPNEATGEPKEFWLATNNVSISRIDIEADTIRLVYWNRVDFLPTALIT